MKKYLLSALIGVAAMGAKAQTATFTVADTVKYTVYGSANVNDNITNNTASPLRLKWKVISHNFPTTWQNGFGICDNITCYNTAILGGAENTTDTFSHTCDFHVQVDLSGAPAGMYYVTTQIRDTVTSFTDTATFIVNKWSTGIVSVGSSNENIILYPMPAHNEVNLLFGTGVRNIVINNVIGKAVGNYRVAGNSASLDISNIPVGVYFARLSDGQGNIIATKKFIKQ